MRVSNLVACLLCLCGLAFAAEPSEIRLAASGVAQTWINTEPATSLPWAWGEGVLVFGLVESFKALGDQAAIDYVREYMDYHMERGIRVYWSDKTTPALAAVELALNYNISEYMPLVDQVAEYLTDRAPRTEQGLIMHLGLAPIHFIPRLFPDLWVDSLFHWVPTLHRLAALTGNATYTEEAVFQIAGFMRNMQDPVTSLLTHAYNDAPLDEQMPAFEELAFWARGNGWVLASLVDTLDYLPESHPEYASLLERTRRLEAAIIATQTDSGLYHTVLLNETTYEETAGSALLTYALARGAHAGILTSAAGEAALRGMDGLMSVLVYEGENVIVDGTSIGTGPRPNLYPYIPTEPQVTYGVGAWLLAAQAVLELIEA